MDIFTQKDKVGSGKINNEKGNSGNGLKLIHQARRKREGGGHIIPTQYYVPPRFSDLATALKYSSVPNRRVGPNNPVGWIFHGKLINV